MAVLVSVGVEERDDMPVRRLQQITVGGVGHQLVDGEECCRWSYPLPGMDSCIHEHDWTLIFAAGGYLHHVDDSTFEGPTEGFHGDKIAVRLTQTRKMPPHLEIIVKKRVEVNNKCVIDSFYITVFHCQRLRR